MPDNKMTDPATENNVEKESCLFSKDTDKLSGSDWCQLLCDQPQFADQCDWSKSSGGDWSLLLREQPQFADKRQLNQQS